ncbi:hypothetical protein TNCV_2358701 [Trichonephila clavipes]|nr:hypothetical protein TNCV_2358701 [Trichonephila clavipes]
MSRFGGLSEERPSVFKPEASLVLIYRPNVAGMKGRVDLAQPVNRTPDLWVLWSSTNKLRGVIVDCMMMTNQHETRGHKPHLVGENPDNTGIVAVHRTMSQMRGDSKRLRRFGAPCYDQKSSGRPDSGIAWNFLRSERFPVRHISSAATDILPMRSSTEGTRVSYPKFFM